MDQRPPVADTRLAVGFRRLAIFIGLMAALAWVAFITNEILSSNGNHSPLFIGLAIAILVGGSVCFAAGWALTRLIGWVVRGFAGS